MVEHIRENIHTAYSLHDMNVTGFEVHDNDIIMRTQSGMVKVSEPCLQVDGHVEFQGVDWDFCFVYLLDIIGNEGAFRGEKMMLKDFIQKYQCFGFSIIDEVYGYNRTKYWGWLTANRETVECIIEIYHAGDMIFVDETKLQGMEEVLLSADDKVKLYSVPAEVAHDLTKYCLEFANDWVWHGSESAKYLKKHKDQYVAHFNAADFIDYLNRWVFPDRPATLVKELDCYDYELPEEYRGYPKFNF